MKIYTGKGDKGMTTLIGGARVPKTHDRIEACGSVDELIAFMGLLRDSYNNPDKKKLLFDIQGKLMNATAVLATETEEFLKTLPGLAEKDIELLEKEIDRMNDELPPIHSFLIPGGHPMVSICHIARTVCRRAERNVVKIHMKNDTDWLVIQYLNRLSDLLYMLSRLISRELDIGEVRWIPEL
jgi:cob(I)alamin adenosyltransferase